MKQNAPYYIKNLEIFNDRIFRYSRILRRIYTFHIQCIIKVEDSELGRYPIYFSVILAMLKYCHRLEGQQEGLLFDAYICNKELHFSKINTCFTKWIFM
jgi:hypothetical protein